MAIVHIVMFEWKQSTNKDQIQDACKRMLAHGDKCVRPTTKQPYVKSAAGGKNNSPEGHAAPHTHGFVFKFENEEDRDYYLNKDPEHLAFVDFVGKLAQSVKVLDFESGKF